MEKEAWWEVDMSKFITMSGRKASCCREDGMVTRVHIQNAEVVINSMQGL